MAGTGSGRSGAAGLHPHRDRHERDTASAKPALRFAGRAVERHYDFRRRIHQRLESREGGRTAYAGGVAARIAAANRDRLEPRRPDLLLYLAQHESTVQRDGFEVAGGLDSGEGVQVRPERGGRGEFRRPDAGISGPPRPVEADFLWPGRSEEHTSEPSHLAISYA